MLRSQTIQLEQSKRRQRLAALSNIETPSEAELGEIRELTTAYESAEEQYRAALLAEGDEQQQPAPGSGEERELGRLVKRASIADYVAEAISERTVDGASKELREATLGEDLRGWMPLELLERRADAVTAFGDSHAAAEERVESIARRVFAASSATYLGIAMPSVGPGSVKYPRITAGTTADVRSDGVELDGTAATISVEEIKPSRVTASYTYNDRDAMLVEGLAEALDMDLRGVLADKLDKLAINGQAAVADTSPAVTGLISSLTAPQDPQPSESSMALLREAYAAGVDGIYAVNVDQVRALINAASYQAMSGVQDANGQFIDVFDLIPSTPQLRVSGNMPAATQSVSLGLTYAAGAEARGLVMPVWRAIQLLNDPYTMAKSGRRILTAAQYVGFQLVDSAPYKLFKLKS